MPMPAGLLWQGMSHSARWDRHENSPKSGLQPSQPGRTHRGLLHPRSCPRGRRRRHLGLQQAQEKARPLEGQCQGQLGERAERASERGKRQHHEHHQAGEAPNGGIELRPPRPEAGADGSDERRLRLQQGLQRRDFKPDVGLVQAGLRHGVDVDRRQRRRLQDDADVSRKGLRRVLQRRQALDAHEGDQLRQRLLLFKISSELEARQFSGQEQFIPNKNRGTLQQTANH